MDSYLCDACISITRLDTIESLREPGVDVHAYYSELFGVMQHNTKCPFCKFLADRIDGRAIDFLRQAGRRPRIEMAVRTYREQATVNDLLEFPYELHHRVRHDIDDGWAEAPLLICSTSMFNVFLLQSLGRGNHPELTAVIQRGYCAGRFGCRRSL